MRSISRLSSGLPATITGPFLPPLSSPSRRVRSRPPFGSSPLWQGTQERTSTGATVRSKSPSARRDRSTLRLISTAAPTIHGPRLERIPPLLVSPRAGGERAGNNPLAGDSRLEPYQGR